MRRDASFGGEITFANTARDKLADAVREERDNRKEAAESERKLKCKAFRNMTLRNPETKEANNTDSRM